MRLAHNAHDLIHEKLADICLTLDPKDWFDIENIFRVRAQKLDVAYLRRWLEEFFVPQDERLAKIEGYLAAFRP